LICRRSFSARDLFIVNIIKHFVGPTSLDLFSKQIFLICDNFAWKWKGTSVEGRRFELRLVNKINSLRNKDTFWLRVVHGPKLISQYIVRKTAQITIITFQILLWLDVWEIHAHMFIIILSDDHFTRMSIYSIVSPNVAIINTRSISGRHIFSWTAFFRQNIQNPSISWTIFQWFAHLRWWSGWETTSREYLDSVSRPPDITWVFSLTLRVQ
jgi:hypothetical protein